MAKKHNNNEKNKHSSDNDTAGKLTNDTKRPKQPSKHELLRQQQDLLYKDKLEELESGTDHLIGYNRAMSYSSSAERLCPSDVKFMICTLCFILIPSGLCLGFTIWQADGKLVSDQMKQIVTGVFSFTLMMCLIMLYNVSSTEPGIIPSVYLNSGITNDSEYKINNNKDYFCEYLNKKDLDKVMIENRITNNTQKFFSNLKYKYLLQQFDHDEGKLTVDSKKKHNKLSYCSTCDIIRPPRSFHCNQCGVCIELHDHHCPWVGTCIGYRNLKFFIGFLFWTAAHAFCMLFICIQAMSICHEQIADPDNFAYSGFTKFVLIYCAMIAFCLSTFFLHQLGCLGIQNITSNEDIRHRWNGHHKNRKSIAYYKDGSGCCSRTWHVLFGNVQKTYGRSKLQAYSELVEDYYKLQKLKKEQLKFLRSDEEAGLLQENREMYETGRNIEKLTEEVDNLEFLERQYGIRIPKTELIGVNNMKTETTEESEEQYFDDLKTGENHMQQRATINLY